MAIPSHDEPDPEISDLTAQIRALLNQAQILTIEIDHTVRTLADNGLDRRLFDDPAYTGPERRHHGDPGR